MECGLVGDGELIRPHCEAAPLLESGDAPLDGVALLVCLGVEAGRAASGATSPQTVTDLIGGLGDDRTDATPTEVSTDRAGRVGAIRKDDRRAGPWPDESSSRDPDSADAGPAQPEATNPDAFQRGCELRAVSPLPSCDQQR